MRILVFVTALLCCLNCGEVQAQGILPANAKSLSKVLKGLEGQKMRPVKVSVENRQWVVDAISSKESVRLHLDPRSGGIMKRETIPDLDPVDSKLSMSRVVGKMEQANPGPIYRVHFAGKRWIVETRRGKQVTEMQLSADTGELLLGRDE